MGTFRRADIVVGPQGSALTNMVSMRSGRHLVLFPIVPYTDGILVHLATVLALDIWMVPELNSTYYGDFNATATRCKDVLFTIQHVLQDLVASGRYPWANQAIRRAEWSDLEKVRSSKRVPSGRLWRDDK